LPLSVPIFAHFMSNLLELGCSVKFVSPTQHHNYYKHNMLSACCSITMECFLV